MQELGLGFGGQLGFAAIFFILATSPAAADMTFRDSSSGDGVVGGEGTCENGPLGLTSPLRVDSGDFEGFT